MWLDFTHSTPRALDQNVSTFYIAIMSSGHSLSNLCCVVTSTQNAYVLYYTISVIVSGSDASQFIAGYTSSTREITLTKVSSTDDIPDQQVISITITGADSDIDSDVDGLDTGAFEIITPTKGTVGNGVENDDVSDALYQWSISSNTLLDGSRLLDSVQSLSQATFFVASIAYSAAYSGVQSDIVLSFQPSAYMPVGSSIVYTLTGFRFDNILPATLRCTGASDSADDFAIDWDASNYELTFTRENSDLDPDILSPSVSVCTIDSSEVKKVTSISMYTLTLTRLST